MNAVAAIVAAAKASPAVVDLVGDRIAAVGMADGVARPNVIVQEITARPVGSNDGPTGLEFATVQLTAYADTYAAARQVGKALGALNGYRGPIAGVTVQSCRLDDRRDAPRPPQTGQQQAVAGVVLTFVVGWNE